MESWLVLHGWKAQFALASSRDSEYQVETWMNKQLHLVLHEEEKRFRTGSHVRRSDVHPFPPHNRAYTLPRYERTTTMLC